MAGMPSFVSGLILDMDGVLIDSEPLAQRSERDICARYDFRVPEALWPTLRGKRSPDIFRAILAACPDSGNMRDLERLVTERRARYLELAETELKLFPGVCEFLGRATWRWLNGIALATSSSALAQRQAFAKFNLGPYFTVVITAEDVGRGKPHPDCYLLAAQRLNLQPSWCLVVEDSIAGVAAARSAGTYVVGITNTITAAELREAGAQVTVGSFAELARILLDGEGKKKGRR